MSSKKDITRINAMSFKNVVAFIRAFLYCSSSFKINERDSFVKVLSKELTSCYRFIALWSM